MNDIDIEIRDRDFSVILTEVKPFITMHPRRWKDKQMDLYGMRLRYKGQQIDISGTESGRLFDKKQGRWVKSRINIHEMTRKRAYGMIIPVIPKQHLIAYKTKIGRAVDRKDVEALTKQE